MNKNKIIFAIIGLLLLGLIFWGVSILNSSKKTDNKARVSTSDMKIWVYELDKVKMDEFVKDFKSTNKSYADKNIVVENFNSFKDYEEALNASIVSGKSPDIFLLNNFENSYFSNQTVGINPTLINPNDFRKNFKTFFGDDLIQKTTDGSGQTIEFVEGIPVGYETLGVFYNKKFGIKTTDLDSWAAVSTLVSSLKERNQEIIPIGIGNGSTVYDVQDIITQFFMLGDAISFNGVTESILKESLGTYFSYGDETENNAYDTRFDEMKKNGKTNLDLFSEGEMGMVIGYPSLINKIDKGGFSKSFLFASPFPHYFSSKGKTLAKYSYFVVNKDTKDETIAFDFLKYLSTDKGATNFLSKFTYLLPSLVSIEQDKLGEKINPNFNVTLGDFYKPGDESLLSSYNKGIVKVYDEKIVEILDDPIDYMKKIKKLQKNIDCRYKKLNTLEGLSINCDEN